MKLLLVQPLSYFVSHGGAHKANRMLMEGLSSYGHQCKAIAIAASNDGRNDRDLFLEELREKGLEPVHSHSSADIFNSNGVEVHAVSNALLLYNYIKEVIGQFDPDWVIVSEDRTYTMLEMTLEAAPDRVILIAHSQATLPFGPESFTHSATNTKIIGKTAGIITVSEYMKSYLKRWGGYDSTVIRFPVYGEGPFEHYSNYDDGYVTMVNPSNIKGISIFIELAKQFGDLPFAAVPTWATSEKDILSLKELPNMTIWNPFENIDDLFKRTKVLIVSSLWGESFGQIIVEAMLRGIPVLASEVGGIPEAKLGVDYVLPISPITKYESNLDLKTIPIPVIPEQQVSPWITALQRLTTDREHYEQVSIRSKEAAEQFVGQIGIESFEQFFLNASPKQHLAASQKSATELLKNISRDKKALLALKLKEKMKNSSQEAVLPAPKLDLYPASYSQEQLWFLEQMPNEKPPYNALIACKLTGLLDSDALSKSIREVMRRHEVLRTRFVYQDAALYQLVSDMESVKQLNVIFPEWSKENEADKEAEINNLIRRETEQPFELSKGAFRTNLIRISSHEHILLIGMHHIICDGWSIDILTNELIACYESYVRGESPTLEKPLVQYKDYAYWQRQKLEGKGVEELKNYWRGQLQGELSIINLPTDYPRPAVQRFKGATESVILPKELLNQLTNFSKNEGVTLYVTLMSLMQTVLYRYTGQETILVGSPVANRDMKEVSNLIGYFTNTIVIKGCFSDEIGFRVLLKQLRDTTMGAFAHKEFPFDKLVELLNPRRDLSYSPVFQAFMTFQSMANHDAEHDVGKKMHNLDIQFIGVGQDTSKFDISFYFLEAIDGLHLSIEYDIDLFNRSTIVELMNAFQFVTEQVMDNPDVTVSDLLLMKEHRAVELAKRWNETHGAVPESPYVYLEFEAQVERTPDAIAFRSEHEVLTYRELNIRANRLANYMWHAGIKPGTIVGVALNRTADLVIGLLAIWKANCAYLPLDMSYPQERIEFIVKDSSIGCLLTEECFESMFEWFAMKMLLIDTESARIADEDYRNVRGEQSDSDLAYLIYTSGSTGRPKGVQIRHSSVINFLCSMSSVPGITDKDVLLALTPISFDISVLELFLPLTRGATVAMVSGETAKDGRKLIDSISYLQATMIQATPATWKMLLEHGWKPVWPIKKLCGGEALTKDLAQKLLTMPGSLWNMYGPTETTVWSAVYEVTHTDHRTMPIGKPIANTQIYILDKQMRLLPPGLPGEIAIGGFGVAKGYYNRPELNAEKFVHAPFQNQAEPRLYLTGDLGRYLSDGNIEFMGRMDFQVKIRGYRIEIGEIEHSITEHPVVDQTVVIVREQEYSDKSLIAYCKMNGVSRLEEVKEYVRGKLPGFMVPSLFVKVEQFPLTPNGKIDRKALPQPLEDRLVASRIAPRTPTEETLVKLWEELLGVGAVCVQDSFFDLGGHSLTITRLLARVADVFQVRIALRDFIKNATIEGLALEIDKAISAGHTEKTERIVRRSREARIPLSFAQKRLWFLNELDLGKSSYNMFLPLKLNGRLNDVYLEKSIADVIHRHEILRTVFLWKDNEPQQWIKPQVDYEMLRTDLSGYSESAREKYWHKLAQVESSYEFDLERELLLRTHLVKCSEEEHLLFFTIHHIICDGWSMGILIDEVQNGYGRYEQNGTSVAPELTVQYADYTLWEQEKWKRGEYDARIGFWKDALLHYPVTLELLNDFARPAIREGKGGVESFQLKDSLTEKLRKLCTQEQTSLFTVLMSAFQALLHRYTNQERFLIGIPAANRDRTEIENLVGCFVNTLAFPCDFSSEPTFQQLIRQTKEFAAKALEQDIPFELVVDAVKPQRELGLNPLFQAMFVFQPPGKSLGIPGLDISVLPYGNDTAKFDLTLSMTELDGRISGSFEYSTELFSSSTIKRMIGHFIRLTESMVSQSACPVLEAELMTDEEKEQLLFRFNATEWPLPSSHLVHEDIDRQCEETPHNVALTDWNSSLTYRELKEKTDIIADYLAAQGVKPNSLIGIYMERSIEMVLAIVGILKAGGTYVPLDPEHPADRVQMILEDTSLRLVLTQSQLKERLADRTDLQLICMDKPFASSGARPNTAARTSATPDDLAYVLYTSGSTGKPKGVMIPHAGLMNRLMWMQEEYRLSYQDRVLQKTPYSFDVSVWEFLWPLMYGAGLIILEPGEHRNPAYLVEIIKRHEVSIIHFVPSMLQLFVDQPGSESCISLRDVICSGEALPYQLKEKFSEKLCANLHNLYGPTEASIDVTYWNCSEPIGKRIVPIGRPIWNTQIYVLNTKLQSVPVGVIGELYIGGVGLAKGYLNRDDLTLEKFIANPFRSGEKMYRTGDLVRFLSEGAIDYVGRADHQVKNNGVRIELGEIEDSLNRCPGIVRSHVLLRENKEGRKKLVAYFISDEWKEGRIGEIRAFLSNKLPSAMIPTDYVRVDQFPTNLNGKIAASLLPVPEATERQAGSILAPRNEKEQVLLDIWMQLLGINSISITDNFFELGGDSILCIQMVTRLNQRGFRVTTKMVFQYQTIADLAEMMEEGRSIVADIETEALGEFPLTPIQQWFFENQINHPHYWNQGLLLESTQSLSIPLIVQTFERLYQTHDLLRATFTFVNGEWKQNIPAYSEAFVSRGFTYYNVGELDESARKQLVKSVSINMQETLRLEEGPLFRAAYFDHGEGSGGKLLLLAHHLIVDGVSWRMLLDDLSTIYVYLSRHSELPALVKSGSYKQWSEHLCRLASSAEMDKEAAYWSKLTDLKLGMMSELLSDPLAAMKDRRNVTVLLNRSSTEALWTEVIPVYRMKVDEVLLTALGMALREHVQSDTVLIDVEGHGREEAEAHAGAIGWFTSVYPVPLKLDQFAALKDGLLWTKETIRAIPHRGNRFGILKYLHPNREIRTRIAEIPQGSILFNYLGQVGTATEASLFSLSSDDIGPLRKMEDIHGYGIQFDAIVSNHQLEISLNYDPSRFSDEFIQALAENFAAAIDNIIVHCKESETGAFTPSDFSNAKTTQTELDKLLAMISGE